MKQWDIFYYNFPLPIGEHPVVVITPDEHLEKPDFVLINVIKVVTLRGGRQVKEKVEVGLNGADGLDHVSAASVIPIFAVPRSTLTRRATGSVSLFRRREIAKKLKEVYRLG